MNKLLFTLIIGFLLPSLILAQTSTEAGLFIGASNYMGDLSPSPVAANETHLAVGGQYRQMFTPNFGVRGTVSMSKISGDDANVPKAVPNENNRRWSMEAGLFEVALHAEWHPMSQPRFNNAGLYSRQFSPFVGLGLGLAFAEAEVKTTDEKDRLKFPENGARSSYFVTPITFGIRFDVTENWMISGEFGVRPTFSDYLDGVSENGISENKDWYLQGGITVLYLIQADLGPAYRN
ncbi:MAG TPA: DUF6089 family protein [Saprospiraceae bacterium]|nr:DUF6089 family protein [Saprospiraceae bacterium]HMQ83733.1 DUF6089 family protein [Saprospiraceae bacterium]